MSALTLLKIPNYDTLPLAWNRPTFREPLYAACESVQSVPWDPIIPIEVRYNTVNGHIESDYGPVSFPVFRCTFIDCSCDALSRLWISYISDGTLYLYWYNPVNAQFEHKLIGEATSCALFLDDQRYWANQVAGSRVILLYTTEAQLLMREQNDRFEAEYLLGALFPAEFISSAGMNIQYRLQIKISGATLGDIPDTDEPAMCPVEVDSLVVKVGDNYLAEEFESWEQQSNTA